MDKRAVAYNALELIRYAIMTAIVIVVVVAIVSNIVQQTSDTRLAQVTLYDNLLLYSAGGFHAQDDHTGRSLPMVIDASRFNDSVVDGMLGHPANQFVAARLLLIDTVSGNQTTIFWNKKYYDIYKPLTTKSGPGAALSVPFHHPVHIMTPAGYHTGLLEVELVTPER